MMNIIEMNLFGNSVYFLVIIQQSLLVGASEDSWSKDLIERLKRHSCKAGHIQNGTTLLHRLDSGTFIELGHVKDLEVCILQCCESLLCELALFKNDFCYGLSCFSEQHCKTAPAYRDEMVAVFVKKLQANITEQDKTGRTPDSNKRQSRQSHKKFLFYPAESSSKELAFSVNLRNIANHYVHNENVREMLTAKADEHLNNQYSNRSLEHLGLKIGNSQDKRQEFNEMKDHEIKNTNMSLLESFLSNSRVNISPQNAQSGKRSKTQWIPKHHEKDTSMGLNARLLKILIPSSLVALLTIFLTLLAITRRMREYNQ